MARSTAVQRDTSQTYLFSRRRPCHCGSVACRLIYQRVMADMSRRKFLGGVAAMAMPFMGARAATATTNIYRHPATPDRPLLLTNLRLFDGSGEAVQAGVHVLIKGNVITDLPAAGVSVADAQIIDCQGKLVMRADRRALAFHAGRHCANHRNDGRPGLPVHRGRRRSRAHADARLHRHS